MSCCCKKICKCGGYKCCRCDNHKCCSCTCPAEPKYDIDTHDSYGCVCDICLARFVRAKPKCRCSHDHGCLCRKMGCCTCTDLCPIDPEKCNCPAEPEKTIVLECPTCFKRYTAAAIPGGVVILDCGHSVMKMREVEPERDKKDCRCGISGKLWHCYECFPEGPKEGVSDERLRDAELWYHAIMNPSLNPTGVTYPKIQEIQRIIWELQRRRAAE